MKSYCHIFDLGGVLIEICFENCFRIWSRYADDDYEDIVKRFSFGESYEAHERGEISHHEYMASVNEMLKSNLTVNQFLHGWGSIYNGMHPNIEQAINRLSRFASVYALTNTNAVHFQVWSKLYPHLEDMFKRIYCSHIMGVRKPEASCYQFVLEDVGIETQHAVFYDDNLQNVEAAQLLGIKAHHVTSIKRLEKTIIGYCK